MNGPTVQILDNATIAELEAVCDQDIALNVVPTHDSGWPRVQSLSCGRYLPYSRFPQGRMRLFPQLA